MPTAHCSRQVCGVLYWRRTLIVGKFFYKPFSDRSVKTTLCARGHPLTATRGQDLIVSSNRDANLSALVFYVLCFISTFSHSGLSPLMTYHLFIFNQILFTNSYFDLNVVNICTPAICYELDEWCLQPSTMVFSPVSIVNLCVFTNLSLKYWCGLRETMKGLLQFETDSRCGNIIDTVQTVRFPCPTSPDTPPALEFCVFILLRIL